MNIHNPGNLSKRKSHNSNTTIMSTEKGQTMTDFKEKEKDKKEEQVSEVDAQSEEPKPVRLVPIEAKRDSTTIKKIFSGLSFQVSWVLYKNGTLIVTSNLLFFSLVLSELCESDETDKVKLRDAAISAANLYIKENGEIMPGSSAGDFTTIEQSNHGCPGAFLTTYPHASAMMTLSVARVSGIKDVNKQLFIGLNARKRRGMDYENPEVISTYLD